MLLSWSGSKPLFRRTFDQVQAFPLGAYDKRLFSSAHNKSRFLAGVPFILQYKPFDTRKLLHQDLNSEVNICSNIRNF
jgi:hypothetical protein